jgi:AraC-like DNA-binding protein
LAPDPLRSLVRSTWSLAGSAEEATLPGIVVPDAHVEFVFHLADPWRMRRHDDSHWMLQPLAFVYAQQVRSLSFAPTGPASLVAFRVSPVVASRILARPISDLWDAPVDLRDLMGAEADQLLELLRNAAPGERFALLHQWIARRLDGWGATDWEAQGLYDTMLWHARTGSIAQVAGSLGPSTRTLRRTFDSRAGLSPKAAQLSGRLLAGCALLRDEPGQEITEIANRVGFYDHAAFSHFFAARTGLTPSQFRRVPHAFFERA